MKPKYEEKAKLCYMDIVSFIVYIKTDNIYLEITKDVKTWFHTSNYQLEKSLTKGKKQKSYQIGEFGALRPKTYKYLTTTKTKIKKAQKSVP